MPHQDYDLIVIGAGAGGLGAAAIAREFGLDTLLIEAEAERVGGDCLNFGCVPSKALIHVSRLAADAREAGEKFGMSVSGDVDFAAALRHVHAAQNRIRRHENADWLRQQDHQHVVIGWAKFVGPTTVEVEGIRFTGRRVILATGSSPRMLDVPGVDGVEHLHTNETFFERERPLPRRLLVVGGGPISCELGQAMRRLGSVVTIVNRGDRLCEKEIPDFSRRLEEVMRAEGVEVLHGTEVARFEGAGAAFAKAEDGPERRLEFDECLVAIGRDVNTADMGLAVADIAVDKGKIVVDDRYRTTNPQVWAVGDAFGREKFSHGAEMHNRDLIVNMLSPIDRHHSLANFSWVTFTDPEIATFGRTAEELRERGVDFETVEQPFTDDDRAIASGYADVAKLVLYVERSGVLRKRTLLGGTMIAPQAGEMIQELVLALQEGIALSAIFNKIYAYPVASRINQAAVFKMRRGTLGPVAKAGIRALWRV